MPSLRRTPFGRWIDPADVFLSLCGDDTDVIWLDSGPDASAGRSYIGRAARVVTSANNASMLEFLRGELAANHIPASPGFALGWVGWLGYETRFETMGIAPSRHSEVPDAAFAYLDRAVEFDHEKRELAILSLGDPGDPGDVEEKLWRTLGSDEKRGSGRVRAAVPSSVTPRWRDTDAQYLAKIRECQARIAAGDAYQLCLTTEATVDSHPDPVDTYLALRAANPSHHGALIRIGDISLLSSSPEQFLSITPSGTIESRPIKGTRPRGQTAESDRALAIELASDEKERAENVMIVDLMRNDIGRVSEVGSVTVPSLLTVESYATVHQLVSTVRGDLAQGLGPIDVVRACFPAGSMTGAPKSSATAILDQLEGRPRGMYSGAFGYFGLDGRVDLAVTIRTIVISPAGASVGAGGGITALSDPDDELAEIKLKAAALLRVLVEPGEVRDAQRSP